MRGCSSGAAQARGAWATPHLAFPSREGQAEGTKPSSTDEGPVPGDARPHGSFPQHSPLYLRDTPSSSYSSNTSSPFFWGSNSPPLGRGTATTTTVAQFFPDTRASGFGPPHHFFLLPPLRVAAKAPPQLLWPTPRCWTPPWRAIQVWRPPKSIWRRRSLFRMLARRLRALAQSPQPPCGGGLTSPLRAWPQTPRCGRAASEPGVSLFSPLAVLSNHAVGVSRTAVYGQGVAELPHVLPGPLSCPVRGGY